MNALEQMLCTERDSLLVLFDYQHLPPHLQAVSKPFSEAAAEMTLEHDASFELVAGLRKLLEAKDCFVRCAVRKAAKR